MTAGSDGLPGSRTLVLTIGSLLRRAISGSLWVLSNMVRIRVLARSLADIILDGIAG